MHIIAAEREVNVHLYAGFKWGRYDKRLHIASDLHRQTIDNTWEYDIQPWGIIDNSGEEPVRRKLHRIDEPSMLRWFVWVTVLTIRVMIADVLQLHKDVIGNE
jgi:hypothetical protein